MTIITLEQCTHAAHWRPFELPGEKGRVFQCGNCGVIGYRKSRYGGGGRIALYSCCKSGCRKLARSRLPGRGPRGSWVWACTEHSISAEPAKGDAG